MFKAAVLNIFLYNGSSKFLLFSFNDRIIGLKGGTVGISKVIVPL